MVEMHILSLVDNAIFTPLVTNSTALLFLERRRLINNNLYNYEWGPHLLIFFLLFTFFPIPAALPLVALFLMTSITVV